MGPNNLLRLNPELIVKQGILYKKGILQRFNKPYMFYFERRDEGGMGGPYLKFGKKGKTVNNVLDLGVGSGEIPNTGASVLITKVAGSHRKIRISTKNNLLVVKCESISECEEWIKILCAEGNANLH
jgi:hypothetical protein